MKTSDSLESISQALADFQSKVEQPQKSADNPFFKSKYVPLENVISAVKKYAPEAGLSYTQIPLISENKVGVTTIIFHTSGEFIEFDPFLLPLDKNTAQGAGSALTYARRYTLSAAFGIASDEDDDGNAASGNSKNSTNKKTNQQAPTKKAPPKIEMANKRDIESLQKLSKQLEEIFDKDTKTVWATYGINGKDDLTKAKVTEAVNKMQNELNSMVKQDEQGALEV